MSLLDSSMYSLQTLFILFIGNVLILHALALAQAQIGAETWKLIITIYMKQTNRKWKGTPENITIIIFFPSEKAILEIPFQKMLI